MKDMYKIITAVVVILVIVGGAFFYYESAEKSNLENFANTIQENQGVALKKITLEEVAIHNNQTDCWMVIDQDVLDVTAFVDKHPGGEVILDGCGKDATRYFKGVREHMKPLVKTLVQKMVIGKLQN